jgi:hypothetical protein
MVLGATVTALMAGCGPAISEMRMGFAPPRPATCELKLVQADMMALAAGGSWEILGHIVLQETGIHNPFEERYMKIVRPRACAMGGEAVSILQAASTSTTFSSGSGVQYAVLRARAASAPAPSPPPTSI